ncbi:MAG TPA: hypothetical protein VJA27_03945 [Patescibacteria group bacterium]|nr:hypothetical protein [Patescibacteria group bacterium]
MAEATNKKKNQVPVDKLRVGELFVLHRGQAVLRKLEEEIGKEGKEGPNAEFCVSKNTIYLDPHLLVWRAKGRGW